MNIQFSFPEISLTSSVVLLTMGFSTQFWFLASIGILGAIVRTAINVQASKEHAELQRDSIEESKRAFTELQNIVHRIPAAPIKKDYTTH